MSKPTNLTALNRSTIQQVDAATQQAKAARQASITHHLEELGKQLRMKQDVMELALRAELERGGVPQDSLAQQELLERCEAFAALAGRRRAEELHREVAALARHLNVQDFPAATVWAAMCPPAMALSSPLPDR